MSYRLTVLTTTRKCNVLSINELGLMQVSYKSCWMEYEHTDSPQNKDASESILRPLRAHPQIRKSCICHESCTIGQGQETWGKLPDSWVRPSREWHGPETSKNAHRIMHPVSGILHFGLVIRHHASGHMIHGPRSTNRHNHHGLSHQHHHGRSSKPAPRHGWAAVFSQRIRM